MRLYLTRHGETQWNRLGKTQGIQDISLSDFGRTQARGLGERLKSYNAIDAIYCSDLSRARETAEIIGDKLGLKPSSTDLLREVSFGQWEGLSTAEIEAQYPNGLERWRNDPYFSPEGGESLSAVHHRISSFLEGLKFDHPMDHEDILIVSHAVTTKVIILGLMELPLSFITRFKINQGGLSLIDMGKGHNSILYLNDTHHQELHV